MASWLLGGGGGGLMACLDGLLRNVQLPGFWIGKRCALEIECG